MTRTISGNSWTDPITRLIDRQLASVWRSHQLLKKQERSTGAKIKDQFPAGNRIEDDMIFALDAKYFGGSRTEELLAYYVGEKCYTQTELAMILGCSQGWISKKMHALSATPTFSGGIYDQ